MEIILDNSDNPKNGREFENKIKLFFQEFGINIIQPYKIKIGVSEISIKEHNFDLGSNEYKIIIECKCHTWTKGNNSPSAKLSVWNEAMYYFYLSNNGKYNKYKKILIVLEDINFKKQISLGNHYIKQYEHFIPANTEIWEYNKNDEKCTIIYKNKKILNDVVDNKDKILR